MDLSKYIFLLAFLVFGITTSPFAQNEENIPISDISTFCSNQKGFNLLGKFDVSWSNKGFSEKEFSVIQDLGFNFVRLPLDYRTYTLPGNWEYFIESEVKKIDATIEWGKKYNVHVCINLHRAPGYCVNPTTLPANQQLNLWSDSVAQKVFLKHWEFFANRYKDISPQQLSFNLVNEPSNVEEADYVSVMKKAIQVIHSISPNRLVFVDCLEYGRQIILSLKDEPNVAQSIHSYDPFTLTHYQASWVSGSSDWPVPQWPMLWVSNYLYGPWKSEYKSPLIFQGNFDQGTEITVNVRQVSIESTLSVKAGSKTILTKKFLCGADPGTDFTSVIKTEWGYQNISNKDFSIILSEPVTNLIFENISGDWMTINSISIKQNGINKTYVLSDNTWGGKQGTYKIDGNGVLTNQDGNDLLPFQGYQDAFNTARKNNIPIMVQEFGVHNRTPHKVAVEFLTDLSTFFREQDMGWALWNLTGSFGILNSSRTDCNYESYQGYSLDREMLDALTKSAATNTTTPKKQNTFKLYPIPGKEELFLYSRDLSGKVKIEIWDITGRLHKSVNIVITGNETIRVNISEIESGLYILSATNKNKVFTGKFLIE